MPQRQGRQRQERQPTILQAAPPSSEFLAADAKASARSMSHTLLSESALAPAAAGLKALVWPSSVGAFRVAWVEHACCV